jgi:hypothetical protein
MNMELGGEVESDMLNLVGRVSETARATLYAFATASTEGADGTLM